MPSSRHRSRDARRRAPEGRKSQEGKEARRRRAGPADGDGEGARPGRRLLRTRQAEHGHGAPERLGPDRLLDRRVPLRHLTAVERHGCTRRRPGDRSRRRATDQPAAAALAADSLGRSGSGGAADDRRRSIGRRGAVSADAAVDRFQFPRHLLQRALAVGQQRLRREQSVRRDGQHSLPSLVARPRGKGSDVDPGPVEHQHALGRVRRRLPDSKQR